MKKIITGLVALSLVVPAVAMATSVDRAFDDVQSQIVAAYYNGDEDLVAELFSVLFELLLLGNLVSVSSSNDEIEIETERATDIEEDEAELHAEIDWNGADRGYVWFEYGEDTDDLDQETSRKSVDDDDDDYSRVIDDLDEDERYYFRAVIEDRDTDEIYYGDIETFRTDDDGSSNNDDEPDLDTEQADEVEDDSAELNGSVDMNDFRNGLVFFVWGESKSHVEDVEDEDEYNDVDEDDEDLQKARVDYDLDSDEDYSLDIRNLDDDTRIYYTICVEYEDEDDDEVIDCGSVEDFRTDD